MAIREEKETIIKVSHLSKAFKLPYERSSSLKSTIVHFNKKGYEVFHALSDVSFEVKKGEFFGILGRNGSGKSTLLKLLAEIYTPTKGSVAVDGTLTPFIELGVGFNPELTGRENVYLNGVILGLTEQEVSEKYDEIVQFAELERFMDQKLKNYSSGMQVRLAFSIAIQAHNTVLLIDEVLAVGDERFQRKCINVFNQIKKDPQKTVVFVSHDMGSVQRFCDRAIVIHDSKKIFEGSAADAIYEYKKLNFPELLEQESTQKNIEKTRWGNQRVAVQAVRAKEVRHKDGRHGIDIDIDIKVIDKTLEGRPIVCGLGLWTYEGQNIAGPNSYDLSEPIIATTGTVHYRLDRHVFNSGEYDITVVLQDEDGETLDHRDKYVRLSVARKTSEVGSIVMGGVWSQNARK